MKISDTRRCGSSEDKLVRPRRQGNTLTPLMLDLGGVKSINDRFGHPTGDEVLRHVAELMTHAIRQTANGKRQTANGKRQTANGPSVPLWWRRVLLLLPDTSEENAPHLAN